MRHKLFYLGTLFFALSQFGFAQFTNVTGTVHDPIGLPYAYGTVVPILNVSGSPTFTSTGKPYMPPSGPSGLDVNGNFLVRIADNTALSPSSSTWTFVICSGAGTVPVSWGRQLGCFSVGPITISGSAQDISSTIQTSASPLTYSASAILQDSTTNCAKLNGPVDLDTAHLDSIGQATAKPSPVSSTSVIGVAVAVPQGGSCIGSVQVATGLVVPCVTDNSSTIGHTVAVSASTAGECTDTGGTSSNSGTFGTVILANGGSGTVSMVLLTLKTNAGTGSPGTPLNSLQYNCSGAFCGMPDFQWDGSQNINIFEGPDAAFVQATIGPAGSGVTLIKPFNFMPSPPAFEQSAITIGNGANPLSLGGFVTVRPHTDNSGNPSAPQIFVGGGYSGGYQDLEEWPGDVATVCNGLTFSNGFGLIRGNPGSAQFCWDGTQFSAPTLSNSDNTARLATTAFVHNYAPQKLLAGTAALGTSAISATSCATAVTVTATGVLTTDSIRWSFNAAPGTGYTSGLVVDTYPTANNVNFLVCNPTAGSLTPAAATLNWAVDR